MIYSKSKAKACESNFLLINSRAVSQSKNRTFQWLLYINKQRSPKTYPISKNEIFWLP